MLSILGAYFMIGAVLGAGILFYDYLMYDPTKDEPKPTPSLAWMYLFIILWVFILMIWIVEGRSDFMKYIARIFGKKDEYIYENDFNSEYYTVDYVLFGVAYSWKLVSLTELRK